MKYDLSKIEFKNEKRFLSNMYVTTIKMETKILEEFPGFKLISKFICDIKSSEHLYQALKVEDEDYINLILSQETPQDTKKIQRKNILKHLLIVSIRQNIQ